MKTKKIKGRYFLKSSYSPDYMRSYKCVGVSISDDDVLVTHMDGTEPVIRFTRAEWDAFLKGVKDGEFDIT